MPPHYSRKTCTTTTGVHNQHVGKLRFNSSGSRFATCHHGGFVSSWVFGVTSEDERVHMRYLFMFDAVRYCRWSTLCIQSLQFQSLRRSMVSLMELSLLNVVSYLNMWLFAIWCGCLLCGLVLSACGQVGPVQQVIGVWTWWKRHRCIFVWLLYRWVWVHALLKHFPLNDCSSFGWIASTT